MKKQQTAWYSTPPAAAAIGLISLILFGLVALRSLDTGSWQQYGIAFALLVVGLNRLFYSLKKVAHERH